MLPFDKRGGLKIFLIDYHWWLLITLLDDWHEIRDQHGIYYSENKTNQFLGSTLKVSNDVIMV